MAVSKTIILFSAIMKNAVDHPLKGGVVPSFGFCSRNPWGYSLTHEQEKKTVAIKNSECANSRATINPKTGFFLQVALWLLPGAGVEKAADAFHGYCDTLRMQPELHSLLGRDYEKK